MSIIKTKGTVFSMGVGGYEINHAHSDVLEVAVLWGVAAAIYAVAVVILGLRTILPRPWMSTRD